jgi:putative transposase
MLGFKSFRAAQRRLAGIEVMHMIKKGQMNGGGGQKQTPPEQFYSLAA